MVGDQWSIKWTLGTLICDNDMDDEDGIFSSMSGEDFIQLPKMLEKLTSLPYDTHETSTRWSYQAQEFP